MTGESSRVQGGSAGSRRVAEVTMERLTASGRALMIDESPLEEPLEIRLKPFGEPSRALTVTMRTPGHDRELAAGFLLTEGVLDDAAAITALRESRPDEAPRPDSSSVDPTGLLVSGHASVVTVELEPGAPVRSASLERNFYTTSSCGVCGKASLLALRSICPVRRTNDLALSRDLLFHLADTLRGAQEVFDRTGGLHAAGLFNAQGELLSIREDVGRHNAVDKLVGERFLLDQTPLRDTVLLLSGRVSFDLMQKAVLAGIPAVVAIGAPSSMAIAVARDFDITLIGFLRDQRCNIYNGGQRVAGTGVTV